MKEQEVKWQEIVEEEAINYDDDRQSRHLKPDDYRSFIKGIAFAEKNLHEIPRVQALILEMRRLLNANYHSLLEATAWLGIREHKRKTFIEHHISNSKFILDEAMKQFEGE